LLSLPGFVILKHKILTNKQEVGVFTKKTVRDVELRGKRVLMRADYNVPMDNRHITDDYRIRQSLPTIKYILEQGASLVIISHLGRPKGPGDKATSLAPIAERLGDLLVKRVNFASDCVGETAKAAADKLKTGQILMFENVRFHPEEEKNDPKFAKALAEAASAQIFVQDGFGVVHRAHASTDAITKDLPAVAGLLLEEEVSTISKVIYEPERPFVAVVGGAKISDKIDILNILIDKADLVAVGGAMANDFLLAEGFKVGDSLVDKESLSHARRILSKAREAERSRNFHLLVPVDAVVSDDISGTEPARLVDLASNSLSDIQAYPKRPHHAAYSVLADEKILDIGPMSAFQIAGAVKLANTVVWNGTLGVTETRGIAGAQPPFSHATRIVVEAMIGVSNRHKNKAFTLVGGGDTVSYVEQQHLLEDFSHVSTGGGASLELMSGHKLPGIEALRDK
jgi:phosphoglycerate kinase